LRIEISTLKDRAGDRTAGELPKEVLELRKTVTALWRFPAPPKFESRIISELPEIFADFRGNRFLLLWRGSKDGFAARKFHRKCDDHGNTMTLILDTNGNIFGGFSPVKWGSPTAAEHKADDSLKSFVFTLKNPHNVSARKFPLKEDENRWAIICNMEWGPRYGGIRVEDNCNTNMNSSTYLGDAYVNDTGLDGQTFFTGAEHFQVKEIEVFELASQNALPGK
jgi:hypothetical protein